MLDHNLIQLAMRTRLLTLSVATTGSVSLSATATGYARTAGSFLADGLAPGMEITATGFGTAANNGLSMISAVTALTATVVKTPVTATEAAGAGRTLACALPASRAWENITFVPVTGTPYVKEQYLPGGAPVLQTVGPSGRIEALPLYVLNVYLPTTVGGQPTGIGASSAYTTAVINLFPPKWASTLSNGDVVRVRGDLAPYRGQLLQDAPGWAVVTVTIPLRVETTNSL